MKTMMLLLFILPLFIYGQDTDNLQGDLYVQVDGDAVYLSQSMVVRNCGAAYDMKAVLAGDTLYWYQVDTGATAVCLCHFNLSVTVDSMPTGHYTAKVYYTECPDCPPPAPDTIYVGSVEFDITDQNSNATMRTIDQDQSDCFPYNAMDDDFARWPSYSIFPNPVQNILHFVTADSDEKEIRIFDLQGRSLTERKFIAGTVDIDLTNYKSGIYIFGYSNKSSTFHGKFIRE
jgi:hypothetical protein